MSRVTEPVELMLPESLLREAAANSSTINALPTMNDLKRYVQILTQEMAAAEKSGAAFLQGSVTKNARTSVFLFVTRIEHLTSSAGLDPNAQCGPGFYMPV